MTRSVPMKPAPEDLIAAMEANLASHLAYLPRYLPTGLVQEEDDIVLVDSSVPSDTFNAVCRARLEESRTDEVIRRAVEHFRTKGFPFAWWVGPTSSPDDLADRLMAQGLVFAEAELGMALDLSRAVLGESLPSGLEVRRVHTPGDLDAYAHVVAASWDPPDLGVVDVYRRCASAALRRHEPARFFLGYLDGDPIATSECFLSDGVAGIYSVVTLPRARRRGIGTALTGAAVHDARLSGYRMAVLQASEQGRALYSRLGFVACCQFHEYHWLS